MAENKKLRFSSVVFVIAAGVALLLFQNCGPGFQSKVASQAHQGQSAGASCAPGETQIGYPDDSVVHPNSCGQPVTRTCVAGQWDRDALHPSCVVEMATPTPGSTATPTPASTPTPTPTPQSTQTPALKQSTFMSGLSSPWDLAFTSDGAMFFTEKCRGLSVRLPSGTVHRLFGTNGSSLVAGDLFCEGQSGMHGVAIDPSFATNRFVYVFMASNLRTNPRTNRVVRLVVNSAYSSVSNRTDIVSDIAYKDVGNAVGSPGAHSGGRIRFGPDGFLYVTTGDNHKGTLPQSLTGIGGKVLRVDRNGAAAPGNRTPGGGDPRIYTYGHRNPQGISFQPGSGQPYLSEHGPGHSDEVTALVAGGNGGWDPQPDAGVTCPDNYCGYGSNNANGTPTSMTDTVKFPTAMRPFWNNEGESDGMSACEFLNGPQWKAWDGRLAVGYLSGMRVDLFQIKADGSRGATTPLNVPRERIRSLVQGVDGNLYVATDSGVIYRMTPE